MSEEWKGPFAVPLESQKEATELIAKLATVAKPGLVYAKPVTVGDHTVIAASEVSVSLGVGYGLGGPVGASSAAESGEDDRQEVQGMDTVLAGGGGGGGNASARPVAVVHISPDGVSVEPVFDVTKILMAFFTMLLSIFAMGRQMRKKVRGR